MIRRTLGFASFASALALTGCTGLSLGENDPNGNLGSYLGDGRVAVDPVTETAFTLVERTDSKTLAKSQLLFGVKAGSDTAKKVIDLGDREDPRLLFLSSGMLVMSQKGTSEEMVLLDRNSFAQKKTAIADTWYWGTRVSATKNYFAVADNEGLHHDIHVIDANSLETHVMPHGGDTLEAMFANDTDKLLAISFKTAEHSARILSWDMAAITAAEWKTALGGEWEGKDLDIPLEGVDPDGLFSFTWVGVSPDDKLAVFPVIKFDPNAKPGDPIDQQRYELVVVHLDTGETAVVPNAKGPVGFTPDGSTIVSYDEAQDTADQRLKLINSKTLEVDEEEVAIDGGISYFVSHDNNYVVVASNWGDQSLVLFDVDNKKQTKMSGPGVSLTEFVSRSEPEQLWIVESGTDSKTKKPFGDLFVADFQTGDVTQIPTPFEAMHIGILPKRDELVLTDGDHGALHFFDPTKQVVVRDVKLPLE
ncbi:MAG: hypothetical protein U0414_08405 [Polyangiaceae bacterium]